MRNNKVIILLVLMLVTGFASVSTTLVLNGVVGIGTRQDDFNVIFTSALLDGVERRDFIDSETKQSITFETKTLTILEETTTLEYVVANTSRLYDANITISCTPTKNEFIEIKNNPTNMKVNAGKTSTGEIAVKLTKTSTSDRNITITCTLDTKASGREELGEKFISIISFPEGYKLKDINNNGEADVGEEIIVGTEHFYLMSETNTEVKALAKYNLNVGDNKNPNEIEGIQNETIKGYAPPETMYGNVSFSDSFKNPNEITNLDIKEFVGSVRTALYGEDLNGGYQNYIKNVIPSASVRLIRKSELESLGCFGNSCTEAPDWVYSTTYWSETANLTYYASLWRVDNLGSISYSNYTYDGAFGVRPVLTIPKG